MQNTDYINRQIEAGTWRGETLPAATVGLSRPLTVFRAERKTNLIITKWHGDKDSFCPPVWSDLAAPGSGSCGLQCRGCFLMLTFRSMRDPRRHVLYTNQDDFVRAITRWLADPARRPFHTLGLGIDRSDSLLYERVTGHVRRFAPLFGSPETNPKGCKLILLTKSANTGPLEEIKPDNRRNVVVTFSLNPQRVADAFEGKYPDGARVPPSIGARLQAARHAQDMGYETRVRLDPILPLAGYADLYAEFTADVRRMGIEFSRWTLGTYREKNAQLDVWREKWGLAPMEWQPEELEQDGTHWHLPAERRVEIYRTVIAAVRREFPGAVVGLCKETHTVRKAAKCDKVCNCMR